METTQYFVLDEVPKDFAPLKHFSFSPFQEESDSKPFKPSDVLLYFANMEKNESQKEALTKVLSWVFSSCESEEQREEFFLHLVSPIMPRYIANLMVSDISSYIDASKRRCSCDADAIEDFLYNFIYKYCKQALQYVEELLEPDKKLVGVFGLPTNMDRLMEALDFSAGIHTMYYRPILGKCKGKFTFLNSVEISDVTTAFNLAIMEILSSDLHIRVCENCGNYFIPASRSDEIYCNRILPSGKTCKMVGYENKVKGDIILREYRKIYKTQHARKQRYKGNDDITGKFNRWKDFADSKLSACQAGDISLEEMIASISGKEWMEQDS